MNYIYYICTHCWKVAIISKFILPTCPACHKRLTVVEDLESMTESLESGRLQMTVWSEVVKEKMA